MAHAKFRGFKSSKKRKAGYIRFTRRQESWSPRLPEITVPVQFWKAIFLCSLFIPGGFAISYAYYSNVYLPSLPNPEPSHYDPFTLLWNGTTTSASLAGGVYPSFVTKTVVPENTLTTTHTVGQIITATGQNQLLLVEAVGCQFAGGGACANAGTAPAISTIADGGDSFTKVDAGNSGTYFCTVANSDQDGEIWKALVTQTGTVTVTVTWNEAVFASMYLILYNGASGVGSHSPFNGGCAGNYSHPITMTSLNSVTLDLNLWLVDGVHLQTCSGYLTTYTSFQTGHGCSDYPNTREEFADRQTGQILSYTESGHNSGANGFYTLTEILEVQSSTAGSGCPSGYNCLFSQLDTSTNNIQLTAKPSTSTTLDSFNPTVTQASMLEAISSAQLFTIGSGTWQITAQFLMNQTANWQGQITAQLFLSTGTPGNGATPTGSPFATSTTILTSQFLGSGNAVPFTFAFPSTTILGPGTYWVSLNSTTVPITTGNGGNVTGGIPKAWFNGALANHNRAFFNPPPFVWTARNTQNLWFIVTGLANSAVALTNSPVNMATSASKELLFYETWHNTTDLIVNQPWGWYLTTNSTLPTLPNYNPASDPSVTLLDIVYPDNGATKNYYTYQQKSPGQQLQSTSGAGTDPYPTCPQTATLYECDSGTATYSSKFQGISNTLNFTGNGGDNKTYSLYCVDGTPGAGSPTVNSYCSSVTQSPTLTPCQGTSQEICASNVLPFLNINGGPYYLGFWESAGQTGTMEFGTSNTGTSDARANSIWYWVPNPTVNTPSVTQPNSFLGFLGSTLGGAWNAVAGVLGPVVAPALSLGNSILQVVVQGLIQAINFLFSEISFCRYLA